MHQAQVQHIQAGLLSGREATEAQSAWDPSGGRAPCVPPSVIQLVMQLQKHGAHQPLASPSRGRQALGDGREGRATAICSNRLQQSRAPARPAPLLRQATRRQSPSDGGHGSLALVNAEQELRWSSDFYGTSKGNNWVENELLISQLFNE